MLNPLHKLGVGRSLSSATAAVVAEQAAQPLGTRKIGAELERVRQVLMACGRELQSAPPFQGGSFVDDTMRLLERLTCRIAIIGQVKAGKSTFINGLVRQPGLLPTDVNPWTTAVTRLHFGRADAPPNVSGEFTFFDANEWERLAQGGGLIRELTQRLVPGFEAELLQKHLDAMRRRSEQRLGAQLGQLLGKKHAFPTLSTEVLERYVCSGQIGPGADHRGIYSDVVKAADLYFGGDDFGFPTTIVDTPGTNDPFLVRDEITRRTLESADIYVVMLTARQALSSADVALLRILRGLHKERIAVFINRIDELGDISRDIAPIVQHVREGLRREFPTTELPIVVGSALWAEAAMRGADADVERLLTPKVEAYARHLAEVSAASKEGSELGQDQARTLFQCSGLSALADVLAPLTLDSHAGRVLTQISRSFSELGRVRRNAAHHELTVLLAEGKSAARQDKRGEEELLAIDAEGQENERLTAALQSLLADLRERADRLIEEHGTLMVEALREVVQAFAEVQCQDLRQAVAEGHGGRIWKCDATLLRQQLEECFVAQFRLAEQEIGKLESHILPKLKDLLKRYDPQWRGDYGELGGAELPLLSALSEVVALDLGEPWWKSWWTRRSGEEQVAELHRLIRNEFYPITEALGQAARKHLEARQAATLEEANMVYMGLVTLLREQNKARLERARAMLSGADPARGAGLQGARDARLAELKTQISSMELLVGRLESIELAWAEKVG